MIKKSIDVFSLKLISAGLGFLVNIMIIRSYGTDIGGQFFYALSLLLVIKTFIEFGSPNIIVKTFASKGKVASLLTLYSALLLSFMLFFVVFLIVSIYLKYSESDSLFYILLLFGVFFSSISILITSALQGIEHHKSSIFFSTILQQFLFVIIMYIQSNKNDGGIALSYFCSYLVCALSSFFYFNYFCRSESKFRLTLASVRSIARESLPLLNTTFVASFISNFGVFFLGSISSNFFVSLYSVCLKVVNLTSFILISVNRVAAPILSRLYNEKNTKKLKLTVNNVAKYTVLIAVPLLLGIAFLSEYLLSVFSPEYSDYWYILCVMCIGQFVNSMTSCSALLLIMSGNQKTNRDITNKCAVFSIVFGLVVIYYLGALGAALLYSANIICVNVLCWLSSKRILKIDTLWVFYHPKTLLK
jgi:O-antigen/teichoic acid export membrane protein